MIKTSPWLASIVGQLRRISARVPVSSQTASLIDFLLIGRHFLYGFFLFVSYLRLARSPIKSFSETVVMSKVTLTELIIVFSKSADTVLKVPSPHDLISKNSFPVVKMLFSLLLLKFQVELTFINIPLEIKWLIGPLFGEGCEWEKSCEFHFELVKITWCSCFCIEKTVASGIHVVLRT